MDLFPAFERLESTAVGAAVRESLWLFPVIESVHLLALALMGGAILVVDLRMLGFGLRNQSVSLVAESAHPWLLGSLLMMVATGIPMFLSEAIKCYYSPPFRYKMFFLVVATVFTFTVRKGAVAAREDRLGTVWRCLTALTSIGLWTSVGFSGRWIAFY